MITATFKYILIIRRNNNNNKNKNYVILHLFLASLMFPGRH